MTVYGFRHSYATLMSDRRMDREIFQGKNNSNKGKKFYVKRKIKALKSA